MGKYLKNEVVSGEKKPRATLFSRQHLIFLNLPLGTAPGLVPAIAWLLVDAFPPHIMEAT